MKGSEKRPGLVHIYCGDGKGKTTAAIGLAVRAAGRGLRVLIVRFLKTDDSGEVSALKYIPGIRVLPCTKTFGFTFRMTPEKKAEAAEYYTKQFEEARRRAGAGEAEVLVLDEILAAVNSGLVPECAVTEFLKNRPFGLEIVLTGRDPCPSFVELAAYVSEIRGVKHPYDQGIYARIGIEY